MSVATSESLRVVLTPPQGVADTAAVLWQPPADGGGPGLVLGHSAGSDLHDSVLAGVAAGLAERGHPVLAFNFAYAEAGRRRPDPTRRLESAFADVLTAARERLPDRPLVLGGRSMGGRIASHLAAQGRPCAGLVFLGYPLHPVRSRSAPRFTRSRPPTAPGAGAQPALRTAHWPELRCPLLFVQGDRDRLCDLALLERERRARLRAAASVVHVVAGADHGFAPRRGHGRSRAQVLGEVVAAVAGWLAALSTAPGRR